MQNKFYLLEDSPEAKDMREHIHNLLVSHDEYNEELAFQLLKGGGIHPDFTALLTMHTVDAWWAGKKIRNNAAFQLLKRLLPTEQITYLRTTYDGYKYVGWDSYLENTDTKASIPFWKELAVCVFYYIAGKDVNNICFKHNLVPSEKIFEREIYNDSIGFYGYDLVDLPDGLAHLKVKYLNFENINFTHIRRKKWTNDYVRNVQFDKNASPLVCRILAQCFPTFSHRVRTKKSEAYRLTTSFMKCVPTEQRDIVFYKKCAVLYKKEGNYAMALKIYLYLHKTYPHPEEIFMFKIAGCYALMRKKAEMLAYLTRHLAENLFYVVLEKDFWGNPEFEYYWKDKEVGKLIASYKATKNE
jgi:hypothetical protein